MCNLYRLEKPTAALVALTRAMGLDLTFPEGLPNFAPRDVRITERAPIVRLGPAGGPELVQRQWSWRGPKGQPVFNFRGEGRRFAAEERCIVPADGFYEYTVNSDPKVKRKDRWLFTWAAGMDADDELFGIAGIVRSDPAAGDAFALLTCPPGPDVAPYHDRQIVLLAQRDWARWLDPAVPAEDLVKPLPAGTLASRLAPT